MRRLAVPLAAALVAVAAPSSAASPAGGSAGSDLRDVVFVANAEGGTVSVVDAGTFEVIREIDVLPDGEDADPSEDPVQGSVGQRLAEVAGGDNFAQDQDVSLDGRTLYVSRGHRGDVAAFDIASGELRWKVQISGFRADHMTLSADGRRLYVSALTDNVVEVVDTEAAEVVGSFPTGEWPHDNHLSHDGARLYNGSIGNIISPREARATRPSVDPLVPPPYQLTVADPGTFEVLETFEFPDGIRPFVVRRDETRLYAQLSEFHGLVEFDLERGAITRELELPVDDGVTEDDYSFEAPHHGLAMTPDESTLCAAGRASDYVALVSVDDFVATAVIEVDDAPSWAENSPDGRYCFVANTRAGTVSVVSYADGVEIARVATGEGPKHLEPARVPADVLHDGNATGPEAGSGAAPSQPDMPATGGGAALPWAAVGLLALAAALIGHGRKRPATRPVSPGRS